MDAGIWSQIPAELLERIISLLPLHTILSLRPTCRRFHGLLLSPSFLSLLGSSSSSSSSAAALILSHPQFCRHIVPLYSSLSNAWHTAPPPPSSSARLLSSSSGLLLFSLLPSPSLLISNPLIATTRLLPSHHPHHHHHQYPPTLISLPTSHPHGYKIFLPSPSSNHISLYDSNTKSWANFPTLHINSQHEGVPISDSLYFTTTQEPFSIVSFHLTTGKWNPTPTPPLPIHLVFIRLVGDGHRLYIVGGVGEEGIARSLHVWEMVGGGWEEIGRLPEVMCRKFGSVCYHNYAHVYCLWHEGVVCVCCTTWPEVLFFKVARRNWHWLPRCPLLQEKWSCGFRWFSFVPDLYALV